ncbi:MAG: NAD(P)-dependent oxidoreductase [Elusimicrobiales bacterium]|nr:NAD(P)-dependent oxidoreductase [Elusimicrobiales bacterium]
MKNKKILILGGCGFIGSYVIRQLLKDNYEITAVDNFSKYGYIEHDFYNHRNFNLIIKDIRTMYPWEFKGYDYIFCLAALIGGIKYFHKIPYRIAKENTEIICHSIDSTLSVNPRAVFVYFSSSMVYERSKKPVTEKDTFNQLLPITNYGMQKLFGEYIVKGANKEFGLKYLIIRPFNAVGSGELPHIKSDGEVEFGMAHVIPDFVYKAIIQQNPFEILGNGNQVRTFTHAKDIAEAVSIILKKKIVNDDFNICGNNTFKIIDLARLIWKKINKNLPFPKLKHLPAPPSDVKFRIGISKKLTNISGWNPKYNIDYIIEDTYNFIKQNLKNGKSNI